MYRPHQSSEFSATDIIGYQHFGASQFRCKDFQDCNIDYMCCGCLEQDYLPNSPFKLTAVNTSRCQPWYAPGRSNGGDEKLPLCRGGSNRGRYLRLPASLTSICGSEKASRLEQAVRTDALRLGEHWRLRETTINKDYLTQIQRMDTTKIWADIFDSVSAEGTAVAESYVTVLKRYSSGNPCMLIDLRLGYSNRTILGLHAVYAPYNCRYHIYSPAEATTCTVGATTTSSDALPKRIVFEGDSMTRELFTAALFQYNGKLVCSY